jgi:hypothetical protein
MAVAFRNEASHLLMFYAVIRTWKLRRISIPNKALSPINFYTTVDIFAIFFESGQKQ